MANIKVSEMTEATSFDDGDYTMIVQANQNKKISKENIFSNLENEISTNASDISTINTNIGNLSSLETDDKTSVVSSINELKEREIYSNNEVKTNKIWIDGKHIYRKVIDLTGSDITTQNTNINHNITNINEMLKLDCIYITPNGARQMPLNYYATNDWDGQLFCTLTQLRFEFGTSALASVQTASHIYVTLEYTKIS